MLYTFLFFWIFCIYAYACVNVHVYRIHKHSQPWQVQMQPENQATYVATQGRPVEGEAIYRWLF